MLFYPATIFRFHDGLISAKIATLKIEHYIMTSSAAEKKHLRRLGHNLKPIVTIASKGLTENVGAEIDRALNDHELIKIKLSVGDRAAKKLLCDEICTSYSAQLVQSIGHILLIFKKSKNPNPKLSNLLRQ
jgi:RNA-binding protein